MIAVMMLLVLVCGGLLAITPLLMPATECFAVSVPPSAQTDPRVRAFRRTYLVATLAVTCVGAIGIGAYAAIHGISPENDLLLAAIISLATFVPIVTAFVLMLYFRSRARRLKEQEGWTATSQRSVAVIADEEFPQPVSLAWNLLYVALAVVLAAYALLNYDRFPERVPMQTTFDGTVTTWADKSLGVVLFPTLMAAFMGLIFTFSHWGILRSKRPINPAAPATSAYAYGMFARTQSLVLLIGGLALSAGIGIIFNLSTMGVISLGTAAVAMSAIAFAFAGAEVWVSIAQGQSGARIAEELRESDELAQDDDAHWLLGSIYCNREDPSIFVPKRFGVGWTMNIGSRTTWILIVLLVVITFVFVWATGVLTGTGSGFRVG